MAEKVKITGTSTVKVRKKPVKAGSSNKGGSGGILTAKVIAIARKRKKKNKGKGG